MWLSQPDSIIPYLTEQTRKQLVDSTAKGEMQEVTNLFSEDTKLTALTADYLSVNLSASSKLTMKLLPTEDNNHITFANRRQQPYTMYGANLHGTFARQSHHSLRL